MSEWLLVAVLVAWVVLQWFVLPRLGGVDLTPGEGFRGAESRRLQGPRTAISWAEMTPRARSLRGKP